MAQLAAHPDPSVARRGPDVSKVAPTSSWRLVLPSAVCILAAALILLLRLMSSSDGHGVVSLAATVGMGLALASGLAWQLVANLRLRDAYTQTAAVVESLHQSEQHYRRIVETAHEGIFRVRS